jgi:hypothetical protein
MLMAEAIPRGDMNAEAVDFEQEQTSESSRFLLSTNIHGIDCGFVGIEEDCKACVKL